jgi:hypothetical protein
MFKQYRKITKGDFILCAVDTSSGGLDYTAAQFLSKTKIDVPLVYHSKVTTADFIPKLANILEKVYDATGIKPVVAIERQNGGSFLVDRLAGINLKSKYEIFKMPSYGRVDPPESVRLGWDTNSATRPKMLQDLKDAIDKRVLTIYDKATINEMYSFVVVQTSSSWKAQAEKNAHDDLIMALAIAWQMYQICEAPQPDDSSDFPEEQLFDEDTGLYI